MRKIWENFEEFVINFILAIRRAKIFGVHSIDRKLNEVSYYFFLPLGSAVAPSEANTQLFLSNLCNKKISKKYLVNFG